jgi:hypothetical protein
MSFLAPAAAAETAADLPIPAADGLETIHYNLAYLIALNCGLPDAFMKEYGTSDNWLIGGEWTPVDSGEFLDFISENLK